MRRIAARERVVTMFPTEPCTAVGAGGKQPSRTSKAAKSGQAMVMWAGGEAAATGVSTALVAVGVSSVVAPVVAVIVLVGHVIIKGTALAVNKRLQVSGGLQQKISTLIIVDQFWRLALQIAIKNHRGPWLFDRFICFLD